MANVIGASLCCFSVTTLAKPFRPQAPTNVTPMANSLRAASPQVVSINQGAVQQALPRPQILSTTVSSVWFNALSVLQEFCFKALVTCRADRREL